MVLPAQVRGCGTNVCGEESPVVGGKYSAGVEQWEQITSLAGMTTGALQGWSRNTQGFEYI